MILEIFLGIVSFLAGAALVFILYYFKVVTFVRGGSTTTPASTGPGTPSGAMSIVAGPYHATQSAATTPDSSYCTTKQLWGRFYYKTQKVTKNNISPTAEGDKSAVVGQTGWLPIWLPETLVPTSSPNTVQYVPGETAGTAIGSTTSRLYTFSIPKQEDATIEQNEDTIRFNLYVEYTTTVTTGTAINYPTSAATVMAGPTLVAVKMVSGHNADGTTTITEDPALSVKPTVICT